MFTLAVKDHVMIAHSFRGELFGPAQRMHGATFVITTEYRRAELDENGIVLDIGLAHDLLADALEPLRYRNLDELPQFAGVNTTTEFLAKHIHDSLRERLAGSSPPFHGSLRVVLEESHVAWGAYEAPLGDGGGA